jgi:uncharacterized protein
VGWPPQSHGRRTLARGHAGSRQLDDEGARGDDGKGDWVANGVLFTLYHLHAPWLMPLTFVDGIFLEAYPSRRFQSAWMGIVVHSAQSVFVIAVVLALVL